MEIVELASLWCRTSFKWPQWANVKSMDAKCLVLFLIKIFISNAHKIKFLSFDSSTIPPQQTKQEKSEIYSWKIWITFFVNFLIIRAARGRKTFLHDYPSQKKSVNEHKKKETGRRRKKGCKGFTWKFVRTTQKKTKKRPFSHSSTVSHSFYSDNTLNSFFNFPHFDFIALNFS